MPTPVVKVEYNATTKIMKIFLNDKLHLHIYLQCYTGMQSWYDPAKQFRHGIEFYFAGQSPILCEYEDADLWKDILSKVSEVLINNIG